MSEFILTETDHAPIQRARNAAEPGDKITYYPDDDADRTVFEVEEGGELKFVSGPHPEFAKAWASTEAPQVRKHIVDKLSSVD